MSVGRRGVWLVYSINAFEYPLSVDVYAKSRRRSLLCDALGLMRHERARALLALRRVDVVVSFADGAEAEAEAEAGHSHSLECTPASLEAAAMAQAMASASAFLDAAAVVSAEDCLEAAALTHAPPVAPMKTSVRFWQACAACKRMRNVPKHVHDEVSNPHPLK